MKKIIAVSLILGFMLMTVGFVVAGKESQKQGREFALPDNAVKVAPGVFYLGKAIDQGRIIEGYAMFVKPGTECGNGVCEKGENARKCPGDCSGGEDPEEPDTSSCYTFLSKGAKWKTVEPYIVDTGIDGIILSSSIDKWETVAGVDILGDEIVGIVDGNNIGNLNGANEVMFADVEKDGVIAVAIVWGIFRGRPSNRELVEWDMVFDTDFTWGDASIDSSLMDFENIATHELGHAIGLGDLYTSECSEQTMYGYASDGETKKQTLEAGDIVGIQKLYK